jgi:SnoaL-like domain
MNDIQSVVQRYIDAWNETNPRQRCALIQQVFAEDAKYTDPIASVRGHAAIDQLLAGVQAQFAGLQFSLLGPVDAHHDQARFSWQLGAPGADEPLVIGFDVAVVENDRVQSVYGFLDKVPTNPV